MSEDARAKSLVLHAVEVVTAFGPERGRLEEVRLREAVPDATPAEVTEALRHAHRIEKRAYELTQSCWGGAMPPTHDFQRLTADATTRLADEFPFIPAATISHLIAQAHYFHSR